MNHSGQAGIINRYSTGFAILVVLVMLLTACQPTLPSAPASTATPFDIFKKELRRQEQKWEKTDISHYRFRLFHGCLCEDNEDVLIEVEDRQILSLEYQSGRTMDAATRTHFETLGTMERIFLAAENELNGESLKVTVIYDPTYGFPVGVFSERSAGSDDELYLTISDFEVLP